MTRSQMILIGLVAVGLVILLVPMSCNAPISKPPFRGCRTSVIGLFGICRHHGSRPGVRAVRLLGGRRLLTRRICDKCGQPRVFLRMQGDGSPYLGCAGFPNCKNPRMLRDYRL